MKFMLLLLLTNIFITGSIYAGNIITKNGKSDYVIYVSAHATKSEKLAADELQKYIFKTSGARLKISHDAVKNKFICVGYAKAKADGLKMTNIKLEGFRILAKNDRIYIYGRDTADGKHTPNGGFSHGTLFGAYTFLEKFVGVRWLIPGPEGESILKSRNIIVPDADIIENPAFISRKLPYVEKTKEQVAEWKLRQKVGSSVLLYHGHNWQHIFSPELAKTHPEWFAKVGNKRVKPTGTYKMCTSNPEVIKYMADALIKSFKKTSWIKGLSVSATDAWGFCECKNCRMLDDKPFPKEPERQYTRRMLIFYNAVAKLVAQKCPDKWVCGYVYQSHLFPPVNPVKMEPNVYLCFASSINYGARYYVPDVEKLWLNTFGVWGKAVPGRLGYYDLPNQFIFEQIIAPQPPCAGIMNKIMPRIKKAGVVTAYIYGLKNYRSGGIINYVNAKMLWNPNLDANAIARDFCKRAYGKSGKYIEQFYDLLDAEYEAFMIKNPQQQYMITPNALKNIYAANFAKLEQLYFKAEAKINDLTPNEKTRLLMLKYDLAELLRALASMELLPPECNKSKLKMSEKALNKLASRCGIACKRIKADPEIKNIVTKYFKMAGKASSDKFNSMSNFFYARGKQLLAVKVASDTEIIIPVTVRKYRTQSMNYNIFDANGKILTDGKVFAKGEIRAFLRGGQLYFIRAFSGAGYYMDLKGIQHACLTRTNVAFKKAVKGFHFTGKQPVPIYFTVLPDAKEFSLELRSEAPGETAILKVYNPAGKQVATLKTVSEQNDVQSIKAGNGKVWKAVLCKAPKGGFDDAWIYLGKNTSGWFSFDPKNVMEITQ